MPTFDWVPLATFLAAFVLTIATTRLVLRLLVRLAVLDRPNDRSSHAVPTPRGGGLAVVPVVLAGLAGFLQFGDAGPDATALLIGAAALATLSWLDDMSGGLHVALRFGVQALCVAAVLVLIPPTALLFGGLLPPIVDRLIAGIGWLWFVNLYNFMDGIDGITGVETLCLGAGVALVAGLGGADRFLVLNGAVLAGAGAGFLVWNWHPARIFLGDVGSVPLGYVGGWLLLRLAFTGLWAAALILPAYYLADATITLARRALRGERVWQAHREHFYQRAVQRGLSHAEASRRILAADAVLIAAAVATLHGTGATIASLAVAAATVAALLALLARGKRPA